MPPCARIGASVSARRACSRTSKPRRVRSAAAASPPWPAPSTATDWIVMSPCRYFPDPRSAVLSGQSPSSSTAFVEPLGEPEKSLIDRPLETLMADASRLRDAGLGSRLRAVLASIDGDRADRPATGD